MCHSVLQSAFIVLCTVVGAARAARRGRAPLRAPRGLAAVAALHGLPLFSCGSSARGPRTAFVALRVRENISERFHFGCVTSNL